MKGVCPQWSELGPTKNQICNLAFLLQRSDFGPIENQICNLELF